MEGSPLRLHWAVALASLVGGSAGSFVVASVETLGPPVTGNLPLLGGIDAIFVASLLGALVGMSSAALVAYRVGRTGREGLAAVVGSASGILAGVVIGFVSESVAVRWVDAFSTKPLAAALVGGAFAGGFAGVAVAASLWALWGRGLRVLGTEIFAALVGGALGMLAGMGGANIGATLAQSATACANGYYANPGTGGACVPGLLQGALLVGIWVGAVAGTLAALATARVLTLARPPNTEATAAP